MSNLSKIKNLIYSSKLSFQEIDELTDFVNKLDKKSLTILIELFEKKPSWILKFYQNIQAKKVALNKKDKNKWNSIIEKENLDLLEMEIHDIE
ncbi:hypothetical protein A3C68_00515 [Candidatus Kuenenbacteria bacterium RIFCSPHIGHO2_02_FULL_42_29]|nr:MAG: hypothetical protein A3C68_00515 [Candidatus Kuenenbacteria bacterium RIFCSPHIGHO2_02_FULL_42_29]